MPSSLGHSVFGLVLFWAFRPASWPISIRTFCLVALVASLADFDFIPGFWVGDPNRFHRGMSHSFGFAVVLTIPVFLFERFQLKRARPAASLWFLLLYGLHIVMDYFGADLRLPLGQPMFWPLSGEYFIFFKALFMEIQRSPEAGEFLPSLLSGHNLKAILRELLLGALLMLGLAGFRWNFRRREPD